ncbi:hypothetical protein SK3146_01342 [Paenibacillus konkukensis]|uniref:Uncharacterized protein n=1 Tax=Paenibacillus konkukensis TaxID=2020716 RepID=A0ABY4RJ94_9BACL|nr:hypothetical protein [Paenibacillus konkukensis]UQZ82185.1 hypothetical protein SK3146_01342 [Paenibacillus konkukensis]
MLSRDTSSNRWLSLILIAVFMIFATPTPSLEGNVSESGRTVVSQGMEYFSNQATVRKQASSAERLRLAAFLAAFFIVLRSMTNEVRLVLPETNLLFHPLIARRLARMLLTPIKFTSLYV